MHALFTCMSVHPLHAWCPQRPEEVVITPGAGVRGGCEPSDVDAGISESQKEGHKDLYFCQDICIF